ncbi:MAG: hypothetical protein EBT15_11650 [Betaproteobacteria bacterium]|nr:hypothetical protein [Betaproteobacteria bacterium]
MTISTVFPPVTLIRSTLERHVLDLYEADGSTLKAYTSWPGYYQLPDGSRTPAVYVTGASMVPSNWAITGIECVIEDVPEIVSPGSVSGVVSIESWNVRFTNYGTKEGTRMPISMLDIQRRIARAFPRDQVTYMARTEVTFEALTARIRGAVLNPPIP